MKLLSFDKVKNIEKTLVNTIDYKEIILMENAANSIAEALLNLLNGNINDIEPQWLHKVIEKKLNRSLNILNNQINEITFLVGSGNNGGDALSVARKLAIRKNSRNIFSTSINENIQNEIKINIILFGEGKTELRIYQEKLLRNLNLSNIEFYEFSYCEMGLEKINNDKVHNKIRKLLKVPILIDGITGIGLKYPLAPKLITIIDFIEENKNKDSFTISIDLPTGSTNLYQKVLSCDLTLMLQWPKEEFFLVENRKHSSGYKIISCDMYYEDLELKYNSGRIEKRENILDINCEKINKNEIELIHKEEIQSIIRKPLFYSHKGNFGKVFVISNSISTIGAAIIASKTAMKSGAGYVYLVLKKEFEPYFKSSLPYLITNGYDDNLNSLNELLSCNTKSFNNTIVIGPGFGLYKNLFYKFLNSFIEKEINVLIDGDGLNIISENFAEFVNITNNRKAKIIFTPHSKEFDRIINSFFGYIEKNNIFNTKLGDRRIEKDKLNNLQKAKFFYDFNLIDGILLKNYISFFIGEEGIYCNNGCYSGYSKAGTGDFIAGLFSALLSNYKIDDAAKILLALQDEISLTLYKKNIALQSIISEDLIEQLPSSIENLFI